MKLVLAFLIALTGLLLCSCGGGGGGGSTPLGPQTAISAFIDWAARTRTAGPSSALSVTLKVFGSNSDGTDFTTTFNRRSDPTAYTEVVASTTKTGIGTFPFAVEYYSQQNGQGDLVAQGNGNVVLTSQTAPSDLGTVSTTTTVTQVTLLPGQNVPLNETKDLLIEARNSDGSLVAVSPGSYSATLDTGSTVIALSGIRVTGLSSGTATLTASVDGISSTSTTVTVSPGQATGQGRILFVTPENVVMNMSGDGSDLRTVFQPVAPVTNIANPVFNSNQSLIAFVGTPTGGQSTLYQVNANGTGVIDLFASALRRPLNPSSPSWSRLANVTDIPTSGLDGIFFIESFNGGIPSGRSLAFLKKSTGAIITGEDADGVSVGTWGEDRPLLAIEKLIDLGRAVEIDGNNLDSPTLTLRQPSVGPVDGNGNFRVLAVDINNNIRCYNCRAAFDGTIAVNNSTAVTTLGQYSWPSISPDGQGWVAQFGPPDSPQIVSGIINQSGQKLLALGRTPSWK